MTNQTKVTGASLGIAGGILTFVGYWLSTGQVPPTEAWLALGTALSGGITMLVKFVGKEDPQ